MDIAILKQIQSNFLDELNDAYLGKKTSLPFIIHEFSHTPLVSDNEVFQVAIIGGSVFRKALVRKNENGVEILQQEQKTQPSFQTAHDVFLFLEKERDDQINVLALNFAYPLKPVFEHEKLDGILLSGSKENVFRDLVDKQVGTEIENYIFNKEKREIKVSVANDTVCLLLSGLTHYSWNELACGIVGTGLNFSFFLEKNKLVNLESANFNKFPQSDEGKIIDKESSQPGKALFEKETTGAYLYKHFNLFLKERNIQYPPIKSTQELKILALQHVSPVSSIAQQLIEYSASFVACQIGGIALFKKQDLIFVMEGSFFWEKEMYKNFVEQYLRKLIPYTITFVKIPDSGIIGAAKLVA